MSNLDYINVANPIFCLISALFLTVFKELVSGVHFSHIEVSSNPLIDPFVDYLLIDMNNILSSKIIHFADGNVIYSEIENNNDHILLRLT